MHVEAAALRMHPGCYNWCVACCEAVDPAAERVMRLACAKGCSPEVLSLIVLCRRTRTDARCKSCSCLPLKFEASLVLANLCSNSVRGDH